MQPETILKQNNGPGKLQRFLEYGLWWLVCVYMFLLLCIMPLYFEDGYAHIGTDKFVFFYQVTTGVGLLFIPLLVIYICLRYVSSHRCATTKGSAAETGERAEGKDCTQGFRLSVTDKFVLGYAASVLLAYFFSEYREGGVPADAWNGALGWNMGARTQLFLIMIYFAVSRFWNVGKKQLALCLPVVFGICLLGIANRFGQYPFPMHPAGPEYITTIGNINWYCSFLVLWVFAVWYYIWADRTLVCWKWYVGMAFLIMGFAALVTQGSLSGIVTLCCSFLMLYLFSMRSMEKAGAFFQGGICLGIAVTGIYLLRGMFGEAYNYPDFFVDLLTNTPLAVLVLVVSVAAWCIVEHGRRQGCCYEKALAILGWSTCVLTGVVLAGYLLLLVINTCNPGCLGVLSDVAFLTFDAAWGSNRGLAWTVGWRCFAEQDLWGKLVGIGPDTMVRYLDSGKSPQLQQMISALFGKFSLTNAHNEWLTMLVNQGLVGMVTYAGIMISAMVRFLRYGKKSVLAGACGMAVFAYTINGMFSFQQIMGTVTLFLALGIGEACMRRGENADNLRYSDGK